MKEKHHTTVISQLVVMYIDSTIFNNMDDILYRHNNTVSISKQ